MIGSKYVTVISVVLIVLACLAIVVGMYAFQGQSQPTGTVPYSDTHEILFSKSDYYAEGSEKGAVEIQLNGDTATATGANVRIDGSTVTVMGGGTYRLTGTLYGNIIIDSGDSAEVHLILNGVTVTASDTPALLVEQAKKTILTLVEGTENLLCDGTEAAEAALFSKDDLTVNGKGALTVRGNHQDGIKANDGFKMTEGTLNIVAADDGMNVNDYAVFLGADIRITADGDAIKCEHTDAEYGFVVLEGTHLNAETKQDGIVASSAIYAKGANVTLNTAEDAFHSDGTLTVDGGTYTIAAGDDGVHAEQEMTLSPDTLFVTESYEGLEASKITINSGDIRITSTDDGINALGENGGGFGMPMERRTNFSLDEIYLTINGGHVRVDAGGDGIDTNGAMLMSDGRLEIYGPENSGNSSLDYEYGFIVNGGELLAAGSSGMAAAPSGSSLQHSLVFYPDNTYPSGATIEIKNEKEETLLSGTAGKRFDWVCISTPTLENGETYHLWIDGEPISTVALTETVTTSGTRGGRRW